MSVTHFNCLCKHRLIPVYACAAAAFIVAALPSLATAQTFEARAQSATSSEEAGEIAAGSDVEQREEDVALRNLKALMWAVHCYAESHEYQLPPAAVPNDSLPPEKRLSGLVLLLPYLGTRPSYIGEDDPTWQRWRTELEQQNRAGRELFAGIDLQKSWDDPANAAAAKSIVPFFVNSGSAADRTEDGLAVSHFAFVRGSEVGVNDEDDGLFPVRGAATLRITDIMDGTAGTLAIGQIHEEPGPWIAAGASTARRVFHPSAEPPEPTFGSRHEGCAWFATGDGGTFFFDMQRTDGDILTGLATRRGGEPVRPTDYYRFPGVAEWRKSLE